MGTMTRLRDNTGVVLWILVIAFGVIWTLQDSGAFDNAGLMAGSDILVVNGEAVTVGEYNRAVNNRVQAAEQRTGQALSPQRRDMIRQQVYESLISNKLREQVMNQLGITVTDQEVYEMILGENPHPFITARFTTEEGAVNTALIRNLANTRPQEWMEIEEYMRTIRREQKLNTLIGATVRVSSLDVVEEYRRRNLTATARYVALPFASIPVDSVDISEDDLREYYDENIEDYARERTFALNYVSLSKEATAEDTANVIGEITGLQEDFAASENDSLFLARNGSIQSFTSAYFSRSDLQPDIAEIVFDNLEEGAIVGPQVSGDRVHLIKIRDVREMEEPIIQARHILISSGTDEEGARQEALDILERVRDGADFAAMARQFSDDTGSQMRGGSLGWFERGSMVAPFEDAAFGADVGEVVGPVETQFGYHIIKVTGRSDREVQIADYALPVFRDVNELGDLQGQLGDLAYFSSESGAFATEAERLGLDVQSVQVEAAQDAIPGIGFSRELQVFLEGAEEGDVTEVIELDDRYLVASVESVNDADYRPFEAVQAQIRPLVLNQMREGILTRRLQEAMAGNTFEQLPEALGVTMRTASDVSASMPIVPGLGRAPRFIGAALGLDEGQTSDVIAGESAVFVLLVTGKNEPPPMTASQRQSIHSELIQQRTQEMQRGWITALRNEAVIEDNRAVFNY